MTNILLHNSFIILFHYTQHLVPVHWFDWTRGCPRVLIFSVTALVRFTVCISLFVCVCRKNSNSSSSLLHWSGCYSRPRDIISGHGKQWLPTASWITAVPAFSITALLLVRHCLNIWSCTLGRNLQPDRTKHKKPTRHSRDVCLFALDSWLNLFIIYP